MLERASQSSHQLTSICLRETEPSGAVHTLELPHLDLGQGHAPEWGIQISGTGFEALGLGQDLRQTLEREPLQIL